MQNRTHIVMLLFVLLLISFSRVPVQAALFDPPTKQQKERFKRSCKKIVFVATKKNEIPIWKFKKDPIHYNGMNVQFRARIVDFYEKNGFTWIKADLSDGKDFVMITVTGSINIKIREIIHVYGVCLGTTDIKSGYGGVIFVPAVSVDFPEFVKIVGYVHDRL